MHVGGDCGARDLWDIERIDQDDFKSVAQVDEDPWFHDEWVSTLLEKSRQTMVCVEEELNVGS